MGLDVGFVQEPFSVAKLFIMSRHVVTVVPNNDILVLRNSTLCNMYWKFPRLLYSSAASVYFYTTASMYF
jgi:hypothetical protein